MPSTPTEYRTPTPAPVAPGWYWAAVPGAEPAPVRIVHGPREAVYVQQIGVAALFKRSGFTWYGPLTPVRPG